jgi:hypothetical protein
VKSPIAWPISTVGLPSHGKQRKHHQVVTGPPDVTPAVDHHVRLATIPSIGIAGQNWAGIAAGVLADRSGYLSTVMHWALASSRHLLDVLIIEHGSGRG